METEIPLRYREVLGFTTRERLNSIIHDIVGNSENQPDIIMSPSMEQAMSELREFMFRHVYKNPRARQEEEKACGMIQALYRHYSKYPEEMPVEYISLIERGEKREQVICDYIAGMTDQYSMDKFSELYIPKSWNLS